MDNIIYSCNICNRLFPSKNSLSAHKRSHTDYKPNKSIRCCSILTKKEIPVNLLNKHENNFLKTTNIVSCKQCNNEFRTKTDSTKKVFCSHPCAAKYSNAQRVPIKKKTIKKIKKVKYPMSKVYLNKCAKTNKIFYSKSYRKYHPSILDDKNIYYYNSQFRFSIRQFPLWFDGELIKKYGWYSTPGSRKGIKNINGISRDHMISRNYGFLNNIDPWYLSHPANCQLIPHSINQSKNSKSSITLDQLIEKIKQFEILYPEYIHVL